MRVTLTGIISVLTMIFILLWDYFKMEINRPLCTEYCIPYKHDMADSSTCVCYDDRYIEIVQMEDIK